jgi:hypothetical protein
VKMDEGLGGKSGWLRKLGTAFFTREPNVRLLWGGMTTSWLPPGIDNAMQRRAFGIFSFSLRQRRERY